MISKTRRKGKHTEGVGKFFDHSKGFNLLIPDECGLFYKLKAIGLKVGK